MLDALDHLCDLNAHDFVIKPHSSFIFTPEDEETTQNEINGTMKTNMNNDNIVSERNNSNTHTEIEETTEKNITDMCSIESVKAEIADTRMQQLLTSATTQQRFLAEFFNQYLHALLRYEEDRHRFKDISKPLPFHIFVNGLAGSGKSYAISIIEQMLADFCTIESAIRNRPRRRKGLLKMAHTGKAALNILGWTIHTALGMVM